MKLFPLDFAPGTFCVLGECDNHYTMETTHFTGDGIIPIYTFTIISVKSREEELTDAVLLS